ncbi:MAG: ABC transporter substrate-binding protein [Chloroflexi bacterium]|nr:ABC transporter substrate-binding protein [Chloroflexota bacterium]
MNLTIGHSNPIPETVQLYTAKEAGIFDKNGLNVDIRLIAGGATAMAAVVSGDTPFSHLGGSEAMSSAAGGADIEVLAVTSPLSSFVLEVAPDIKSAADLKGKHLGISTIGSSSDIALRTALIHLGIDADKDVIITPVGSTANRTAAMLSGAIQGSAELPADVVQVEKAGFHPLLDMAAMKIPSVGQSIVAQRAYVAAHHDVTQKYVDSIIQAGVVARADRDTAIKTISKWTKVDDLEAIGVAYDLYERQTYTPTPLPDPALWADAKSILGAKNDAIKNYDVSKLVDPSFVQSAIDRGLNK